MNIAMILAGGVGSRVGAAIPKQFIVVREKPIIIHTLELFQDDPEVDAIEIVCIRSHMDVIWEMARQYGITKLRWVCEGGDDYQGSVLNGMHYLEPHCTDEDIVLIHFAVSPFIDREIIDDSIAVCKEHGNGIATNDNVLCLCTRDPEYPQRSELGVDRSQVMGLNAPQTFRYGYLKALYAEGFEKDVMDKLVDPHTTTLMLELGHRIYFSKSSQANIKITTKEDLLLFEGYLMAKELRETSQTINKEI